MMPYCDYSRKILWFHLDCHNVASRLTVINGHQLAACAEHEHWFEERKTEIQIEQFEAE